MTNIKHGWKTLNVETLLTIKPWFAVVKESIQLPNGQIINDFYKIHARDYVEIVPMNHEKKILGVWHYKHGVKKYHLGLPAGYIESEETPLQAAQRELNEECQLQAKQWQKLGAFALEGNRGFSTAHMFLACNCTPAVINLPSDDIEEFTLEWLSITQWLQYIKQGEVAIVGAVTAILLTALEIQEIA